MRKSYRYGKLFAVVQHLRNGLASKALPTASVALPLRSFMKAAVPELNTVQELVRDDPEALSEVLDREVTIEFVPVQMDALASDDYALTLTDIEVLEALSEEDDGADR